MEEQARKESERAIYNRTANRGRPSYGSFWNRGLYDEMMSVEYEPELDRLAAQYLRGKKVLILGSGPGEVELVQRVTNDITAINISEKAVRELQGRFPTIRAFVADAEKLDSLQDRFDAVFCKSILHHLHPIDDVLASIARRLTPEGVLLVAMEPGLLNPFAAFGRAFTPSESHTPGERPFVFSKFSRATRKHFVTVYEKQHFVWSMLIPIAARRAPKLESVFRAGLRSSVMLERWIRRAPFLRDLYWIMTGVYRVTQHPASSL